MGNKQYEAFVVALGVEVRPLEKQGKILPDMLIVGVELYNRILEQTNTVIKEGNVYNLGYTIVINYSMDEDTFMLVKAYKKYKGE